MFSKSLFFLPGNATYTLSVILFATATCYILGKILKLYKLWKLARNLPGPRGLPLLGILLDVTGDTESLLKTLYDWSQRYTSLCCTWLGPKLFFGLYDPDSLKELLENQKEIKKPSQFDFFGNIFGNGLLTAPEKMWRVHRRLVTFVFNHKELLPFGQFFAEKAHEMVKEMEVELGGKGFEIQHYITPCTLRMIFGIGLGTSLKFESGELCNIDNDIARFFAIVFMRMARLWLYPDVIFNRTALGREFNAIADRLTATIKKALKQAEAEGNAATARSRKEGEALPGLLLKLPRDGNGYTHEEFLYELNTFIGTGSHTLATQLNFLMRMLAYNPEIQDKVYDELYGIYGSADPADRPVMREDLSRLEYLECAIHESMRLFPPVPFIARDITKDINTGSCVLPAGSTALIVILNMHRSDKYWPNPLKFDPDRFLLENKAKRVEGAYIPFSSGPRNCPGRKYAMIGAKIITATLLRRYILRADTIVPAEDMRLRSNIVMEFVEPWKLRIEERNPKKVETERKTQDT